MRESKQKVKEKSAGVGELVADIVDLDAKLGPVRKCEQNRRQTGPRNNRTQTEKALRQSQETLGAILNSIADVVLLLDKQGTVLAANQPACREYGAGRSDLVGLNIRDFLPRESAKSMRRSGREVVRTGTPVTFSDRHGDRHFDQSIYPVFGSNGKVEKLAASRRDVTAQTQAEGALQESEERLRDLQEESRRREELYVSLLNSSPDPVILYNMEGHVQYVNPAFTRIFGWTEDEVAGRRIDFLPDSEREITLANVRALLADGTPVAGLETKRYTKDGRLLEVSVSASRYHDHLGAPAGQLIVIRDISGRKRAARELEKALETARQLRAQAEAASKAKSDFVANMSHEIRTPMNAVIGLSDLALRAAPSPKLRDYLSKIRSASRSLLGIINDILDFSKIEAGKLDLELVEFDLRDVMRDLTNLLGVVAAGKGLEFVAFVAPNVPCGLKGDPLRLAQILTNLANNAIKFTDQGEIVVSAALVQEDSKRATISFSVRDSGIGLAADKIPKLFDSFSQADGSTTRKYGGSGLGLTISKRLVEAMGGEIQVESEPEQGSTFSFVIDFEFQQEAEEENVAKELEGIKVLVVDDNEAAREILLEILSSVSVDAIAVESGEKAVAELVGAASRKPYDLVLMDWNMPGMNGIDAAKKIDADPRLGVHIPKIVMVTAYGCDEVMEQAREAGLDGFLVKPVDQRLLFDTILEVLGKQPVTRWGVGAVSKREAESVEKIRGARILVAEDNEINQQVAREILEGAGIIVEIAANGVEAVRAVSRSYFDAVLMDVQMPEMDGYEATRTIRSKLRQKSLPIVAMTAHALKEEREKCLEAGMNDHVPKPIDIEELLTTLTKWVKPAEKRPGPKDAVQKRQEVPGPEEFPEILDGIDIDAALRRLGHNRRLLKKLLMDFRRDFQQTAEEIKDAWNKGDMEVTLRLAHTVKGVSGNIGAEKLQDLSQELEAAIKQGGEADFQARLGAFRKALRQVLESIGCLDANATRAVARKTRQTGSGADLQEANVEPLLLQLAEFLRGNDFRAVECLESLKTNLADAGSDRELLRLEACVGRFDFKEAYDALQELARTLKVSFPGTDT